MKISKWKPSDRDGKRKGSFDVTLPSGLTLHDCSLVEGEHGLFIGLPQRSYQNGGQLKYVSCVSIEDKDTRSRFNMMVLDALREARHIA